MATVVDKLEPHVNEMMSEDASDEYIDNKKTGSAQDRRNSTHFCYVLVHCCLELMRCTLSVEDEQEAGIWSQLSAAPFVYIDITNCRQRSFGMVSIFGFSMILMGTWETALTSEP